MIYAAAKPITEYNVTLSHCTVGLYDSYRDQPELLALIMISTPFGYDYEGTRKPEDRRVRVTESEKFIDTLTAKLEGKTIKDHLNSLNPLEFYQLIKRAPDKKLEQLSIIDLTHGSVELFRLIVGARAAAWALNYRGKLSSSGNKITAVFGGNNRQLGIPEEIKQMHYALVEELKHGS